MNKFRVFYKFQERDAFAVVPAETSEAAMAELARQFPQITTVYKAEIEQAVTKMPKWLEVGELIWDADMARFLATLAEKSSVFSDSPSHAALLCENKFFELSGGEVCTWPGPPDGSVAEAERYGARAIISFSSAALVPASLQALAHEGKIQRMSFFWALVALGFVMGKTQNIDRIAQRIPSEWRATFEECVRTTTMR